MMHQIWVTDNELKQLKELANRNKPYLKAMGIWGKIYDRLHEQEIPTPITKEEKVWSALADKGKMPSWLCKENGVLSVQIRPSFHTYLDQGIIWVSAKGPIRIDAMDKSYRMSALDWLQTDYAKINKLYGTCHNSISLYIATNVSPLAKALRRGV